MKNSVFIIDDHPVYRDALGEKLGQAFASEGVEVAMAGTAQEGIERIQQSNRPWVVLLDILMPGLSGLAGIKVFKDLPMVQHVVASQAWMKTSGNPRPWPLVPVSSCPRMARPISWSTSFDLCSPLRARW